MAELMAGELIGKDRKLTDFDCRLLWVLTSHLGYGNSIRISLAELGRRMDRSRQHVQKSMTRLIDQGYVEKDGRYYKLSQYVGYRGERRRRIDEKAKAHGLTVIDGQQNA